MEYRFNRDCWVESSFDGFLLEHYAYPPGETADGPHHPQPVASRIGTAQRFFADRGESIRTRPSIAALLQRFRDCSDLARAMMRRLGIAEACARCDRIEPHGSCCSIGLEEKIDAMILVVNLLIGVELPKAGTRPDSCFFLGPQGCTLFARHMLCVDYLCPDLEKSLPPARLHAMQIAAGNEIEALFRLGEEIKRACRIAGR